MKCQDKLEEIFLNNNSLYRKDNFNLWEDVLFKCDYVPYEFTNEFIEYDIKYESQTKSVKDFSVILFKNMKPIGLLCILYIEDYDINKFKILSPIYITSILENQITDLNKELFTSIIELTKFYSIKFNFIDPFINSHFLSNFHLNLLQHRHIFKKHPKIILELKKDISLIRMNFRKSYKSLINNGLKLFNVQFLTGEDIDLWHDFQNFHIKISGKKTRSDQTWQLNYNAILNGRAFLAYIKQDGDLIGAAYFLYSKSEAIYGVGVYERELSHLPISHSIQYAAICKLRELNVDNYCLGISLFSNQDNVTSKELNISHFKRGFGGNHAYSYEFLINYE
jgi:FemAB family protein